MKKLLFSLFLLGFVSSLYAWEGTHTRDFTQVSTTQANSRRGRVFQDSVTYSIFHGFSINDVQQTLAEIKRSANYTYTAAELVKEDTAIYVYAYTSNNCFQRLQPETGEVLRSTSVVATCSDLAYDATSKTLYGICDGKLQTVERATGSLTPITYSSITSNSWLALAIDSNGYMYAIPKPAKSSDKVSLAYINTQRWSVQSLGRNLAQASSTQSMAFEPSSNQLYWWNNTGSQYNYYRLIVSTRNASISTIWKNNGVHGAGLYFLPEKYPVQYMWATKDNGTVTGDTLAYTDCMVHLKVTPRTGWRIDSLYYNYFTTATGPTGMYPIDTAKKSFKMPKIPSGKELVVRYSFALNCPPVSNVTSTCERFSADSCKLHITWNGASYTHLYKINLSDEADFSVSDTTSARAYDLILSTDEAKNYTCSIVACYSDLGSYGESEATAATLPVPAFPLNLPADTTFYVSPAVAAIPFADTTVPKLSAPDSVSALVDTIENDAPVAFALDSTYDIHWIVRYHNGDIYHHTQNIGFHLHCCDTVTNLTLVESKHGTGADLQLAWDSTCAAYYKIYAIATDGTVTLADSVTTPHWDAFLPQRLATYHYGIVAGYVFKYEQCESDTAEISWTNDCPVDFYPIQFPQDTILVAPYGVDTVALAHYFLPQPIIHQDIIHFLDTIFVERPAFCAIDSVYELHWTVNFTCGTPALDTQYIRFAYPPCGYDSVTGTWFTARDIEGNEYQTVRLGHDCWLAENLRSTLYSDTSCGLAHTPIPVALSYSALLFPDSNANVSQYGRLYDWYSAVGAVTDTVPCTNADAHVTGVCPQGWYLPDNDEYQQLWNTYEFTTLLTDTNWITPMGNNATGFSLAPAGYYNPLAKAFFNLGGNAYLWTSSHPTIQEAVGCQCKFGCPSALFTTVDKNWGFSIRCLKE